MGNSQSHTSEVFTENGEEKYAKFDDNWFEQGASRYAYLGRIKPVHSRWFQRDEKCVVKLYKADHCAKLKEDAWKADNRASLKAKEMADTFNVKYSDKGIERIEFLIPIISKVKTPATYKRLRGNNVPKTIRGAHAGDTEPANVMVPEGASVSIERFIQGQYVYFLSNSAHVNQRQKTIIPEAFSHFTYAESKGEILVTDLQGVHTWQSYIFTDPAVHSMEQHGKKFGHYGPTDLGVYGVMKFFLDHECNDLCKGLLTPDTSGIPSDVRGDLIKAIEAIKGRSSTTYTYELLVHSGLTADELQKLHTAIVQVLYKPSGTPIPQTVREFMTVNLRAIGSRLVNSVIRRVSTRDKYSVCVQ